MTTSPKPTKSGVVRALFDAGYGTMLPPSLSSIEPATAATQDERDFADYLIADTDFGGAWNDASQIDMHLV
jgi:hypothetical protein